MYKVTGNLNGGLEVKRNNELILYSAKKGTWFKGTYLKIFNAEKELLLEVLETGFFNSKYKILYVNKHIIDEFQIVSSFLSSITSLVFNSNVIKFKAPIVPFITKDYGKFYLNENYIGFVKTKNISLEKKSCLSIEDSGEDFSIYILILFLLNETGYDPDY